MLICLRIGHITLHMIIYRRKEHTLLLSSTKPSTLLHAYIDALCEAGKIEGLAAAS